MLRRAWPLCALFCACAFDWSLPADPMGAGGGGGVTTATSATVTTAETTSVAVGGGGAGGEALGGGGMGGEGGSGTCTVDGDDNACEACLKTVCCADMEACDGDPYCECTRQCIIQGAGQGCIMNCGSSPTAPAISLGACAFNCTECG